MDNKTPSSEKSEFPRGQAPYRRSIHCKAAKQKHTLYGVGAAIRMEKKKYFGNQSDIKPELEKASSSLGTV